MLAFRESEGVIYKGSGIVIASEKPYSTSPKAARRLPMGSGASSFTPAAFILLMIFLCLQRKRMHS